MDDTRTGRYGIVVGNKEFTSKPKWLDIEMLEVAGHRQVILHVKTYESAIEAVALFQSIIHLFTTYERCVSIAVEIVAQEVTLP